MLGVCVCGGEGALPVWLCVGWYCRGVCGRVCQSFCKEEGALTVCVCGWGTECVCVCGGALLRCACTLLCV